MKIYLDNIKKSDADKIAKWKSDKELSDLILSNTVDLSIPEAEEWIEKNSNDKNQRLFGIYIRSNDFHSEIVGITRLMFIDFESGVAELGIYLGDKEVRGQGVGDNSIKRTLEHAYNDLSLNKVFLKVKEDNVAAIKLYNKYDFVVEGKLKEHFIRNNSFANNNLLIMSKFKNK